MGDVAETREDRRPPEGAVRPRGRLAIRSPSAAAISGDGEASISAPHRQLRRSHASHPSASVRRAVADLSFIHFLSQAARAPVRAAFAVRAEAASVAAAKIRIRLKSFEVNHMKAACDKIIEAATSTEASISGPVPLPTKRRIYCVLRSPHVNKDSREHFETRTHHRLIDVHQPTAQTIDALMSLELPAGVEIEVKL